METERFKEAVSDLILLGKPLQVPPGSDELWTKPQGSAECATYRLTWGWHQGQPAAAIWTTSGERAWAYAISERILQRLNTLAPTAPAWEKGKARPTVPLAPPKKSSEPARAFPLAALAQLLASEAQKGTRPEQLARLIAQTLAATGALREGLALE
ncbi:MAG: hypothetical protein HY335_07750 [Deinococcus sp.]|nr:hypothetical protein [Deinococcus sp.]